jgi:hypothetical protein
MSPDFVRALEQTGEHLLAALAAGTAAVCIGAALVLLWDRIGRGEPSRGASYVGRPEATGLTLYVVSYTHIARLAHASAAEPLAAAVLRHYTGDGRPLDRYVTAVARWIEEQPDDGFVLEAAGLERIVGAPLAGRRRLRARHGEHVTAP